MSTVTLTRAVTFAVVECCDCGVLFGIPQELDAMNQRKPRERSFWCPNGHSQHYLGKSFEAQLREAHAQTQAIQDQLDAANREAKRLAKRAAAGVCPCCARSFVQLARHMKTKHPEHAP